MEALLLTRTADLGLVQSMEGYKHTRNHSSLRSPPPRVPSPRGSREGPARGHARRPRPASCRWTPEAVWIKCTAPIGCGEPSWAREANRCIEMQIRHYKRGGAAAGGRREGVRAVAVEAAALLGTRALSAFAALLSVRIMAPPLASGRDRAGREDEDRWEARGDRKARKPLVEKKRRARINESLQELRLLLAGPEVRQAGGRRGAVEQAGGWWSRPCRASPPFPTRRPRWCRCRPNWRTPRCWS